jgi:hypothetical protein
MIFTLEFKSSAHERYNTDMNDRVRLHFEQAGIKVVGEFGGTAMMLDESDPAASDNGFDIETDQVTAQRLSHELEKLLDGRPVYVQPGGSGG